MTESSGSNLDMEDLDRIILDRIIWHIYANACGTRRADKILGYRPAVCYNEDKEDGD